MPEGLEVEIYRRAAESVVGRRIESVWVDTRCSDAPVEALSARLCGARVSAASRHGKQMVLSTSTIDLGLHFGMAGRLVVDERAPIDRLQYASGRDDRQWDRLVLDFGGGGMLRINDPRRWCRITIDPSLEHLGPDYAQLTRAQLMNALGTSRRPLKAVLLDQHRIAGLGNMCVDELLWQSGISPLSVSAALGGPEIDRLHRTIRRVLPAMLRRGGSHMGVISPDVRRTLPPCPRDGAALQRGTVGGRTTIWCASHQELIGERPDNPGGDRCHPTSHRRGRPT